MLFLMEIQRGVDGLQKRLTAQPSSVSVVITVRVFLRLILGKIVGNPVVNAKYCSCKIVGGVKQCMSNCTV